MTIKAILFDFDGTVANTNNLIETSFKHSYRTVVGEEIFREQFAKTFGLPLVKCMEIIAPEPKYIDGLLKEYRVFNDAHHDELIRPFDGVKEALEQLYVLGIKMGIVTSKKAPMCRRGLRCLGLEEYVSAVVGCDSITNSKPHAEPMLKAAELLMVKPEECLCVGDSYFDLQSGHNAGCGAMVAVSYSTLPWERVIEEGKPDYIIDSLKELLPLVKRLNQA